MLGRLDKPARPQRLCLDELALRCNLTRLSTPTALKALNTSSGTGDRPFLSLGGHNRRFLYRTGFAADLGGALLPATLALRVATLPT